MSEIEQQDNANADASEQKPGDETTFTQADVERIVRERLERQAKSKFGDYEDLKNKADQSQTLEQRIAEMEARAATAETSALRSRIAAEFGVSAKPGANGEPSDADLFLTGSDEATLKAQAARLVEREGERKKQGNFAPKEGAVTNSGDSDESTREFVRNLFKTAD